MTNTIQMTPLVYTWLQDLQIDEKYEFLLRDYAWCLSAKGRPATGNLKRKDGSRKFEGFIDLVYLHQLIMWLEHGEKSDARRHVRHLNHDRLNNKLENLAFGTSRDNKLDHEYYTGVNPTTNGKWYAKAMLGSKTCSGRYRENREDAQFDYDMMVVMYEYHGIFPKTLQERRDLPKYVYRKNRTTKPYEVSKNIAGRMVCFGSYVTLEEAVKERDKFIANNWTKSPRR